MEQELTRFEALGALSTSRREALEAAFSWLLPFLVGAAQESAIVNILPLGAMAASNEDSLWRVESAVLRRLPDEIVTHLFLKCLSAAPTSASVSSDSHYTNATETSTELSLHHRMLIFLKSATASELCRRLSLG